MLDKVTAIIFRWEKVTAVIPSGSESSARRNLSVFHWIQDLGCWGMISKHPSHPYLLTLPNQDLGSPLVIVLKLFLSLSRTHTLCLSPPPALLHPQKLSQHILGCSWALTMTWSSPECWMGSGSSSVGTVQFFQHLPTSAGSPEL